MIDICPRKIVAACVLAGGLSSGVAAAPITFGNAINIGTNTNSLNQYGEVVGGVNFGPRETTLDQTPNLPDSTGVGNEIPLTSTVSGITFQAVNTAGSLATVAVNTTTPIGATELNSVDASRLAASGGNAANTGNAAFNAILDSNVFRVAAGFQIALNGLTNGTSYIVQLFAIRGVAGTQNYSDPSGLGTTSGTVNVQTAGGQYVLGRFTAQGSTQLINVNRLSGNAYLSALVLRVAVPEISVARGVLSLALFGFVTLLLGERKRIAKIG